MRARRRLRRRAPCMCVSCHRRLILSDTEFYQQAVLHTRLNSVREIGGETDGGHQLGGDPADQPMGGYRGWVLHSIARRGSRGASRGAGERVGHSCARLAPWSTRLARRS